MTIRKDARTRIDLLDYEDTRAKILSVTELTYRETTDIMEKAGGNESAVRRCLQTSDRDFAVIKMNIGKNMWVIEL